MNSRRSLPEIRCLSQVLPHGILCAFACAFAGPADCHRLSFGVVTHTNVLFVFGTRPEAIKLCPVLLHMRQRESEFSVKACVTAQHRGMLDQVLSAFQVAPDYDLDVMQAGQTLAQSTARILSQLEPILAAERPDMVLVQGDTTTTLSGAL